MGAGGEPRQGPRDVRGDRGRPRPRRAARTREGRPLLSADLPHGAGRCRAPVAVRPVPRGRGGPGRIPRPVGARALQVDDHHLRRLDPGDSARPRDHDRDLLAHAPDRDQVPPADQGGARAEHAPDRAVPGHPLGEAAQGRAALVPRDWHRGEAHDQPEGGHRRGARPGRRPADRGALQPPGLRRRRDPGEREHARAGQEDDRGALALGQPRRARRRRDEAQVAHRHALQLRRHVRQPARAQGAQAAGVPSDRRWHAGRQPGAALS